MQTTVLPSQNSNVRSLTNNWAALALLTHMAPAPERSSPSYAQSPPVHLARCSKAVFESCCPWAQVLNCWWSRCDATAMSWPMQVVDDTLQATIHQGPSARQLFYTQPCTLRFHHQQSVDHLRSGHVPCSRGTRAPRVRECCALMLKASVCLLTHGLHGRQRHF
jgi:hypothetical protein